MNNAEKTPLLVCIDDTDELHGIGTGKLAQMLSEAICEKGWGVCQPISRHQLYVHPDIPYTSHNSAMCFAAEISVRHLEEMIEYAAVFLKEKSAAVADPGLCVVNLRTLTDPESLIAFGQKAKKNVLKKEEAYNLAGKLQIHLSEHGGTGQGVIGALAGTGLRLSGNDGRFKGRHEIETVDGVAMVGDILAQSTIDEVRTSEGYVLGPEEKVSLEGKIKSVLLDGKSVLLIRKRIEESGEQWINYSRDELRSY